MSVPAAGEAALPAATAGPGQAGPLSAPAAMERCANCGAPLSGPYCNQCGQRHEHAVHSFRHFIAEGFEDLTHADSRLWRTLGALVFRPGFLTREFLDGRRVRYLPPVRLYLVLSLAFFLVAGILTSYSPRHGTKVLTLSTSGTVRSRLLGATPASARQECAQMLQQAPWLRRLGTGSEARCAAAIENSGRGVDTSLLHIVPRAMFLFLPLLGVVMKALYRRPPRHYVEHLLFFVHNHALIFLLLAVYALIAAVAPAAVTWTLGAALCIYLPGYFFVSMLRVYGQGWLATAGKLTVLSCVYLVLAGSMLAAMTYYAMFGP